MVALTSSRGAFEKAVKTLAKGATIEDLVISQSKTKYMICRKKGTIEIRQTEIEDRVFHRKWEILNVWG